MHSQNRTPKPMLIPASGVLLDPNVLTLGFARRFATYKRADLLFQDIDRLKKILTDRWRPVQIIFAGNAHPARAVAGRHRRVRGWVKDSQGDLRNEHRCSLKVFKPRKKIMVLVLIRNEVGKHVTSDEEFAVFERLFREFQGLGLCRNMFV